MNIFNTTILLILLLLTYIEAQKEGTSDEQGPSYDLDEQKKKNNDFPLDKKDNQSKNYQSLEAGPGLIKNIENPNRISNTNERTDREDNKELNDKRESNQKKYQTKLPMNCIQDYEQFCKTKFFGYK